MRGARRTESVRRSVARARQRPSRRRSVGGGKRCRAFFSSLLGAALSYATYVVLAKSVVPHLHPLAIAGVSFGFAALFLLPAAVPHGTSWEALRPVWLHLTYLAVVPTAIAYALYVRGLQGTSATAAGIGSLMEPLTASLLGMAAFGESLGGTGLLGAGLLLGAVALLFFSNRSRP